MIVTPECAFAHIRGLRRSSLIAFFFLITLTSPLAEGSSENIGEFRRKVMAGLDPAIQPLN